VNHILAGYLLVEPYAYPAWKAKQAGPKSLITASDCICEIHPGKWGLNWASQQSDVESVQTKLGLTNEDIVKIQGEVQNLFDAEKYGFPNVFLHKEDALQFKSSYLGKIECHLIRLSLPEPYLKEALEELKPETGMAESGVYHNLKLRLSDIDSGECLGYELLCWDTGGFHSFICNGLENEYEEELLLRFNSNGFFDNLETAITAVEYTRRDEVGAEPGFWAPFKMVKEQG
jgi:hypothetical protein